MKINKQKLINILLKQIILNESLNRDNSPQWEIAEKLGFREDLQSASKKHFEKHYDY